MREPYICLYCDQRSTRWWNLKIHMKRKHGEYSLGRSSGQYTIIATQDIIKKLVKCLFRTKYYELNDDNWIDYYCDNLNDILASGLCIFHDRSYLQDKINREKHEKDVKNKLMSKVRKSQQNKEVLRCIGYYIPDITIKGKFTERVYFSKCEFQGEANFSRGYISTSAEDLDEFRHINADDKVARENFMNAWLEANLEAKFAAEANFYEAKFQGEANFSQAKFQGKAIFDKSKFSAEANFTSAEFRQPALFWNSTFCAEADFWQAKFCQLAHFVPVAF
jgi:hypothetical protein